MSGHTAQLVAPARGATGAGPSAAGASPAAFTEELIRCLSKFVQGRVDEPTMRQALQLLDRVGGAGPAG
jgi:hypothetical protein